MSANRERLPLIQLGFIEIISITIDASIHRTQYLHNSHHADELADLGHRALLLVRHLVYVTGHTLDVRKGSDEDTQTMVPQVVNLSI